MFNLDEAFSSAVKPIATFTPNPEESAFYSRLFRQLDTESKGTLSNSVAIPFLLKSKLPPNILRDIWALVDTEQTGILNTDAFYKILKLVSIAQSGKSATLSALSSPSPLPIFEGVGIALDNSPKRYSSTTTSPTAPVYTVSLEEKDRFRAAFANCSPVNGQVGGDTARDFFIKSGLPVEVLSKIWVLADSNSTGSLNQEQFMVAMFFIMKIKAGVLQTVPATIPPALWSAIVGESKIPPSPSTSADSASLNISTNPEITAELRAQADHYFDLLDKTKKGFLTGGDSYDFFLKSNLPGVELARIWEACDKSKSGKLTKEEFTNAMWMIKRSMATSASTVPTTITRQSTVTQPSSVGDLLDLSAPSSPNSKFLCQQLVPVANFASPKPAGLEGFKPLAPPPPSGLRNASFAASSLQSSFTATPSVLDTESDVTQKRQEIKELEKQYDALKPASEELATKRAALDGEYKALIEQKNQLTIKMSQARAMYDAESQILVDTQNILQREKQLAEMSKQECAQLEAALAQIRTEKGKMDTQLRAATEEIEKAKAKTSEFQAQTVELREKLDKLRSEMSNTSKILEVNQKLLQNAQQEYQQIKMDLQQTETRFDYEKSRAQQMQNQIAVQSAITEKERQKIKNLSNQSLNLSSAESSTAPAPLTYTTTSAAATTPLPYTTTPTSAPVAVKQNTTATSAKDDFDSFFEANRPKKSSPSKQYAESASSVGTPVGLASPNMQSVGSPSMNSDTSPQAREGSVKSLTFEKAPTSTIGPSSLLNPQATANQNKPVTNPSINPQIPSQINPQVPPPLPPQSTKPSHAPGKEVDVAAAFSLASNSARSASPENIAFQTVDKKFDFDQAFGTSPAKKAVLGKDSFDAAFGIVDRPASPAKSMTGSLKDSSPQDQAPEVSALVAMGFPKDKVIIALEKSGFDQSKALDELTK